MESKKEGVKKGINVFFAFIAFFLGLTLYKQFNFETMEFKKPALAIVYFITIIISITLVVRGSKKDR